MSLVLFVVGPAHGGQPYRVCGWVASLMYLVLHLSAIEPAASEVASKWPEVMAPLLL